MPSSLNHRHVEVFHAVMSTGQVTLAATMLRTSQPTISRELRDMERRLGFSLFYRQGRHLHPTDEAVALFAEVRQAYIGLDQIARAAGAIRDQKLGHVNVACLPAYASGLLPEVINAFLTRHPEVRVSVYSYEQSVLARQLAAGRYDFGLLEGVIPIDGTEVSQLWVGQEMAILPPRHPLAAKAVLEARDFDGQPFIHFCSEDPVRLQLDRVFGDAGVRRRFVAEATTSSTVCAMVEAGLGVSIINPVSAQSCLRRGMDVRPLAFTVSHSIGLYRPKLQPSSRALDEFAQTVREVAARVRQDSQPGLRVAYRN